MSEAFILGAVNMTNQWEHYRLQTTNHKSRRKCHVHVIILIQIENKKPSNATMSSADFQVRSQRWNVTAKYNSESDLSLSSPNPKIHIPVNFGGEGGVVKKRHCPILLCIWKSLTHCATSWKIWRRWRVWWTHTAELDSAHLNLKSSIHCEMSSQTAK